MSFVSGGLAVIAFALAALWCVVGIAGLTGRLARNKWVGVRADETMRSDAAFAAANRAAGPGMIAAAVISAVGAGLALSVGGGWGIAFVVVALVVAVMLIGIVSALGIKAAVAVPDEESPAADCGEASCGSCALSGMCTNEAAQA